MNNKDLTLAPLAVLVAAALLTTDGYADHLSGGFGVESAAPIVTNSAATLRNGLTSMGVRSEFGDLSGFSRADLISRRGTELNRTGTTSDIHSADRIFGYSFRAAHGFGDNLTLGVRIPYVQRQGLMEPEEGHAHGSNPIVVHSVLDHGNPSGLGDTTVFGMYRFFKDSAQDISFLFGVKAPTGETHRNGSKGTSSMPSFRTTAFPDPDAVDHHSTSRRLETHLQPGSGSWDGIMGLAYSRPFGKINFDSSVLYTLSSRGAQRTDLGDTFNYDFALSYPISNAAVVPCSSCIWNVMLEMNGEYRQGEEVAGARNANSGGNVVYLSPGLRLIGGPKWNIGTSVGYAVVPDVNGIQSAPNYRVLSSLNINF